MTQKIPSKRRLFRLITLGCSKNQVDSDKLCTLLKENGYSAAKGSQKPDVIFLNTCSFTHEAREATYKRVENLARQSEKLNCYFVLLGCLPNYLDHNQIKMSLPVHALVTTDCYLLLPEILEKMFTNRPFKSNPAPESFARFLKLSPTASSINQSAFLKLSEGCSNKCTFCSIPLIRGPLYSRSAEEIVKEAKMLTESGVLELNLIGQEITAYGQDQPNLPDLAGLLRLLLKNTQAKWIRLNYCHPTNFTEELIDLTASEPRICPYLDLPLQHISQQMLKAMARGYSSDQVFRLLDKLFRKIPRLQIVSSFIVGFPGETQKHFNELLEFIDQGWFRYINVFPFSRETGTRAELYPNNNSSREIKERQRILTQAQRQVFTKQALKWKSESISVILEGPNRDFRFKDSYPLMGRSLWDAPEDARVFLRTNSESFPKGIIKAKIEGRDGYDLLAVS
ncbi:MiaB/RimO family radical SAM methylthiotransferase [Dethiosulfatarculus sandiegensis]|uniref:Uncharacterized protein n=1 Tax=Dethiosulfatarculus sandiegensis TaxID=1429043 RepID=A0A0D2HW58_9BACT|nr:MiaB/RimO family radical SAM methylthiotransferase [Dethiosulfatarculus sandiegensis]KIX14608.1 hypothetical protein X474_07530 [Dethiosulfatarculus sandiegensis]